MVGLGVSNITHRSPSGDAFAWADSWGPRADVESAELLHAQGRVLARAVHTDADLPARRTAAVDGFALRAADTHGAGDYSPMSLVVRPLAGPLLAGEAKPVAEGDPMPEASDVVLPGEWAELRGGMLEVVQPQVAGDRVAEPGEEYLAGDLVLPEGRRLRPQDLAMLALLGRIDVPVWRQPVVRILLAGRYVREADAPMLVSLVGRDGGRVETLATACDAASLGAALTRPGADLIVVAGATGEGASDHAVPTLRQVGAVHIRRVAIHPGGEVALGEVAGIPVVLLPGSPLACFAAYDMIVGRLLRRLARLPGLWPYPSRTMPLRSKLTSTIGRLEMCRVEVRDGQVEPLATRDGRRLASVVRSDGFVIVPECSEGYGPGAQVLVHLYE